MLQIVFNESAAGSLKAGVGPKGTMVLSSGFRNNHAEKARWETPNLLEGTCKDILCFPLALDIGEIDEDGIGPKREAALAHLTETDPSMAAEVTKELLNTARKSLDTLLKRAAGEPICIWLSAAPDEACGVCWLMEQMQPIGLEKLDAAYVTLPEFEERSDGTVVQYRGWGEIDPYQWVQMAKHRKKLPLPLMKAMAAYWKKLRKDNAPVRTVLNGRLDSAPITVYDWYILQEIAAQDMEFREAMVIGKVLSRLPGIGDGWLALRIEQFIRDGLLVPVTEAPPDRPIYRRILRRCEASFTNPAAIRQSGNT